MGQIGFWILIAVVIGTVASFITMVMSRHSSTADTASTSGDLDSDLEGSRGGNIMFLITVFSILAFLIIWLVNAVMGRGMM